MTGVAVTFDGSGASDDSILICTGSLGGTVAVSKTAAVDFTFASGCTASADTISTFIDTMTINGTMNVTGSTFNVDSWGMNFGHLNLSSTGTITYAGTAVTIEGNFTKNSTWDLTGVTIALDGTEVATIPV